MGGQLCPGNSVLTLLGGLELDTDLPAPQAAPLGNRNVCLPNTAGTQINVERETGVCAKRKCALCFLIVLPLYRREKQGSNVDITLRVWDVFKLSPIGTHSDGKG